MGNSAYRLASLIAAIAVALFLRGTIRPAQGQDFFKPPPPDAAPTSRPNGPAPMFSFSRYESELRALCSGLEEDGRRERLVRVAEAEAATEKTCISCRSLWRSIVSACGRLGPKPTPTPKAKRADKKDAEKAEATASKDEVAEERAAEGEGESEPTPEPSPASTRIPDEKYPSTALLDLASRVSTDLYGDDPGDGAVASSFRNVEAKMRAVKDLTAAESEYFDIFFTYLMSAWQGRVDPATLPTPTPRFRLEELFE